MKFQDLATHLEKLEKTSSRITITQILAELFTEVPSDEISMTVNLLLGRLAPNYENMVFNIADKMMIRAISTTYGVSLPIVLEKYKHLGDLGLVAYELAISDKKKEKRQLDIKDVYTSLTQIAEVEGEGSQDMKVDRLAELLQDVDPLSAKFITRVPIGKLRLGFSDKTIIDSLSWMIAGDKSLSKRITVAYEVFPDAGKLAQSIKEKGVDETVRKVTPVVGVPVQPMLAQRLKSPVEMIEKMHEVVVEPKYDGLRILIHFKRNHFVKTFTRNLNETTWMFPEIEKIGDYLSADELILDSEAVGLDESTKKMANFQTTMTRRRKHDVAETREKVSIQFFIFDILSKDSINLMKLTFRERRKILEKTLHPNKVFRLTPQLVTTDPNVIREEHKKLIDMNLEGVIVKKIDSTYVPGRTGWRWVKMKEVEEASGKLSDTLDCVIMGYTQGKGKRAGFGMGQFLAGILDGEEYKTITKVGTGLTDEQLESLSKRLHQIRSTNKPNNYVVHKDLEPDFWVDPEVVVELAADEITKSPNHTSGYALRFPRLIKFRSDKDASRATSLYEVKQILKLQQN